MEARKRKRGQRVSRAGSQGGVGGGMAAKVRRAASASRLPCQRRPTARHPPAGSRAGRRQVGMPLHPATCSPPPRPLQASAGARGSHLDLKAHGLALPQDVQGGEVSSELL